MPVSRFQFRRANASAWTSANPTLAAGELGYELDAKKFKIGDGTTAWTGLDYASSGGPTTDGETVFGSGYESQLFNDNMAESLVIGQTTTLVDLDSYGDMYVDGIDVNGKQTPEPGQIVVVRNISSGTVTNIFDGSTRSPLLYFLNSNNNFEAESVLDVGESAIFYYGGSASSTLWRRISGGDATTSGKLSQFGTTSSYELSQIITDETGTGNLVFATNPTLTTPRIGSGGLGIAGSSSGTTQIVTASAASGTVLIPAGSGTVATLTGTQTLTNKTLTTPQIQSSGFGIAGSSSGTTIIITAAAASGTVLIPAGAGTVATLTGTQTLTNKTLTTPQIQSGGFGIAGSSSGTTTVVTAAAASGTVLIPAGAGTVATLTASQTLTNKTLTTPQIQSGGFGIAGSSSGTTTIVTAAAASGTVLIPAGAGTVATLAGTETLTNKTVNLTSNTLTGTLAQFNTALSDQDFASLAGTETLSNKTFVAPILGAATGTSLSVTGALTSTAGSVSALGLSGSLLATSVPAALSSGGTYGASAIPARSDHVHPTTGLSITSGTETLTNKTINLGSNTVTGTLAQFNTALSDQDFATLAGTETLTNKTLTSPNIGSATGTNLTLTGTISAASLSTSGTISASTFIGALTGTASGNLANTLADAKGKIPVGNGTVPSSLALGTDGYVLTADSSQSLGVKWAAAAGGGSGAPFTGDSGNGGTQGLVPAPAAGDAAAAKFLRASGGWAAPVVYANSAPSLTDVIWVDTDETVVSAGVTGASPGKAIALAIIFGM